MHRRQFFVAGAASAALAGCTTNGSKFKSYHGPEVTGIVVNKGDRKMYLVNGSHPLKQYDVSLGFAPVGHKEFEGDGRTPEGNYVIDRRNPHSRFHLSLGISYPRPRDIARARAMGKNPGGDIFIHGQENPFKRTTTVEDWTWGCIAVTNREIETIYAMVRTGTPITINA